MRRFFKFKVYCETDQKWEHILKEVDEAPTQCPVDSNHTITTDSGAIEEVVPLENQKDSEGAALQRPKFTHTGWTYQLHGFEFTTSDSSSIYSKNLDNENLNFVTMKFFKDNEGQIEECSDQNDIDQNCIMTQVDWEPTYDYEIIGGHFWQKEVPNSDIRLWVTGLPDIPEEYGGNKQFVSGINLQYISLDKGIAVDGRAPKLLPYNEGQHTNKIRFTIRHLAGKKHDFHISFEIFKG